MSLWPVPQDEQEPGVRSQTNCNARRAATGQEIVGSRRSIFLRKVGSLDKAGVMSCYRKFSTGISSEPNCCTPARDGMESERSQRP
jgi:hypothetical protein